MNLEQIDTSTTQGKIKVMELFIAGRKIYIQRKGEDYFFNMIEADGHRWNWEAYSYFASGRSEEVWVTEFCGKQYAHDESTAATRFAKEVGGQAVRYIRADLAGERG